MENKRVSNNGRERKVRNRKRKWAAKMEDWGEGGGGGGEKHKRTKEKQSNLKIKNKRFKRTNKQTALQRSEE